MRTSTLPEWGELLDRFEYLPQTGELIRKWLPITYFKSEVNQRQYNSRYAGETTGCTNSLGYSIVGIGDKLYAAHRVVWKWVTGDEPGKLIDHLNGIKRDNRFENLRELTKGQENQRNNFLSSNNTSGHTGVNLYSNGKWVVSGTVDYKKVHLGYYDDFEKAVEVRREWEKETGFTERHGESKTNINIKGK